MGVYDFNLPRYNVDSVVKQLRDELHDIANSSKENINEVKKRIEKNEKILNQLKDAVDNLPDYTEQYNMLMEELNKIKVDLQNLIDHPIKLGYIVLNVEDD